MAKLRPLNDTIIVDPDPEEWVDIDPKVQEVLERSKLVIPDAYVGALKKTPMRGRVVSYGKFCKYSYREGDRLIFGRFAGVKLHFGDKDYLILREKDVLAEEEE